MKKFILMLAAVGLTIGCALCLAACSGGKEYTITCENPDTGYVIVADNTVKSGDNVILAAKPNAGYKFVTFKLDGEDLDGCSFVMPERDVTVSAAFTPITYTVTYVTDTVTTVTFTVEDVPNIFDIPENDGYEICGWYTYFTIRHEWDREYEEYFEDYRVKSLEDIYSNVTLYAKYFNPPHNIKCDDDGNGYIYTENYNDYASYGETVNLIIEPKPGYELDFITVNDKTIDGTSFPMTTGDVEVFAAFKPIRYKITYIVDGIETDFGEYSSYTVESDGQLPPLPPETEQGCYIGWCIDEECTMFIEWFDTNALEDLTFYAQFYFYE